MFVISVLAGVKYLMLAAPLAERGNARSVSLCDENFRNNVCFVDNLYHVQRHQRRESSFKFGQAALGKLTESLQ